MPGSAAAKGDKNQPFLGSDSDFVSDSDDGLRSIRSASSQSYNSQDYGTSGGPKYDGNTHPEEAQAGCADYWFSFLNCCCLPCGLIGFVGYVAADKCAAGCADAAHSCAESPTVQTTGLACALYCASGQPPAASSCCGCC